MVKKISHLIMLLLVLTCSITLSVTYSKYLLTKTVNGQVHVPQVDYCVRKGITSLSECMLVMENYSSDANSAKLYISSKTFTTSKMAPTINYQLIKKTVENSAGIIKTKDLFSFSQDYIFDETTGMFTFKSYKSTYMSDDYLNYYTCGSTTVAFYLCSVMYQVLDYEIQGDYTLITKANVFTFSNPESFDSEIGLYQTEDDYGISYFYRGNVKNNYVSYAGFMWRIVRQNGDGSIRLIYAGTDGASTGESTTIGISRFNHSNNGFINWHDPTHVGYMYGENFALKVDTTKVNFNRFSGKNNYYFADSYEFDEAKRVFKLAGNTKLTNWTSDYSNILSKYPYTCFGSSSSSTCPYIVKAIKYNGANAMHINYITYGSVDYASTLKNTYSSVVKTYVDTWYENNILNRKDDSGNLYTNYLSDNIFCNDRSLYLGNGYSYSQWTRYNTMKRNGYEYKNATPSLKCTQFADKFTVNSSAGNQALKYPVALITIDEAAFAGGLGSAVNTKYYLYNGLTNWTMSPHEYQPDRGVARPFFIGANGEINGWYVWSIYYVRPVINLKSDIKITGGDGTADNPYVVSL